MDPLRSPKPKALGFPQPKEGGEKKAFGPTDQKDNKKDAEAIQKNPFIQQVQQTFSADILDPGK